MRFVKRRRCSRPWPIFNEPGRAQEQLASFEQPLLRVLAVHVLVVQECLAMSDQPGEGRQGKK